MRPIGGELVTTITFPSCWRTHFLYLSHPHLGTSFPLFHGLKSTATAVYPQYPRSSGAGSGGGARTHLIVLRPVSVWWNTENRVTLYCSPVTAMKIVWTLLCLHISLDVFLIYIQVFSVQWPVITKHCVQRKLLNEVAVPPVEVLPGLGSVKNGDGTYNILNKVRINVLF